MHFRWFNLQFGSLNLSTFCLGQSNWFILMLDLVNLHLWLTKAALSILHSFLLCDSSRHHGFSSFLFLLVLIGNVKIWRLIRLLDWLLWRHLFDLILCNQCSSELSLLLKWLFELLLLLQLATLEESIHFILLLLVVLSFHLLAVQCSLLGFVLLFHFGFVCLVNQCLLLHSLLSFQSRIYLLRLLSYSLYLLTTRTALKRRRRSWSLNTITMWELTILTFGTCSLLEVVAHLQALSLMSSLLKFLAGLSQFIFFIFGLRVLEIAKLVGTLGPKSTEILWVKVRHIK